MVLKKTFESLNKTSLKPHLNMPLLQITDDGGRPVFDQQEVLRDAWHLRSRLRHLGRREPRAVVQDLDVRWNPRDRPLFPCRPHFQKTVCFVRDICEGTF